MKFIIEAIEARLQAQKDEIEFQQWQIADLKHKLEDAEKQIKALEGAAE